MNAGGRTAAAAVVDWSWCVGLLAVLCLMGAAVTARLAVPTSPSKSGPSDGVGERVRALAAFSLALGFGPASVNTFFALYGVERLDLSAPVAA